MSIKVFKNPFHDPDDADQNMERRKEELTAMMDKLREEEFTDEVRDEIIDTLLDKFRDDLGDLGVIETLESMKSANPRSERKRKMFEATRALFKLAAEKPKKFASQVEKMVLDQYRDRVREQGAVFYGQDIAYHLKDYMYAAMVKQAVEGMARIMVSIDEYKEAVEKGEIEDEGVAGFAVSEVTTSKLISLILDFVDLMIAGLTQPGVTSQQIIEALQSLTPEEPGKGKKDGKS